MTEVAYDAPLGLYIHIPFCERKCPYCDFNTYAGLQSLFAATVEALCQELAGWRDLVNHRQIHTIFLGGGTPTVLSEQQLAQLFHATRHCFRLRDDCEITCEANPGTVDRSKFALLRSLGVNRLSLGVQSFQPETLSFLGRIHDVDDVYRAYAAARTAGFENINLDFMFGLPDQTPADWSSTLSQALALEPEHLSLYSLIVEPNTPLAHWVDTGQVSPPDEDRAADLYEIALDCLETAGYVHYEVSNWAKNQARGQKGISGEQSVRRSADDCTMPPFASRHNLLYWRNDEYLGIGPGAHSHLRTNAGNGDRAGALQARRWGNRKPVQSYIRRMSQDASPPDTVVEFSEEIDDRLAMGETMMLGLRLVEEGVPFERFRHLHGVDLTDVFHDELEHLRTLDLVQVDEDRVRLTRRGLMLGNQVCARFLPDAPSDQRVSTN